VSVGQATLDAAAQRLGAALRPVILIGPEGATAAARLLQVAERLGAAVLTTPDAKSVVDHHRSCGTFSFGASVLARRVMEQADVVLAVSALGEFACRLGQAFTRHTLIQVTERASDVGRNVEPAIALVGSDIAATVQRLQTALTESGTQPREPWYAELSRQLPRMSPLSLRPGLIHPVAAITAVEAALPAASRVCLDVTSGALHAYEHLRLTTSQRAFSSIENGACMSEALMASLGVRIASDLPTLTIVGDWGYCMAPAELHSAVELGLGRYVVLVWANSGGAFIGAGVKQQGIVVPDDVWRWKSPPRFAEVARAYGARGVTVRDAAALQSELSRALAGSRPVLIEAMIDGDIPVPAGDRFLTLGDAQP
jgi:thiamine pyrophosphate-dependent acetolactate synthase large subunit-like protein